jgi:phosphotriesterase-related protein
MNENGYRVQTIDGIVVFDPSDGVVLPHEHIVSDSRVWWEGEGDWQVFDDPEKVAATQPDELHSRPQGVLRQNLLLSDWYLGASELALAKEAGTQLVFDVTVLGAGANVEIATRAARMAGISLVVSAGRYLDKSLPEEEHSVDEDELVDRWTHQIEYGYDGLMPGLIGEIGTSEEITPDERISLRAAGRVQAATGLALNIHVHPFAKRALEAISIAEAAGADPSRIAISHLDCEIDLPQYAQIMATGAYVEFDNFGTGRSRFVNGANYPDDEERFDTIAALLDQGLGSQLLLSHDINHRNSLVANGGWGYRHIAANIVPVLREHFGAEVAQLLTAENPLRLIHIAA